MINYQKKQKGNATLSTIVIAASALLIGSYVANNMDSITGKSINKLHAAITNSTSLDLISETNTLLSSSDPILTDLYALQSKINDSSHLYTLNSLKNKINNAIEESESEAKYFIEDNNYNLFDLYLLENQTNTVKNSITYLEKTESTINYIKEQTEDPYFARNGIYYTYNSYGNQYAVVEKNWLSQRTSDRYSYGNVPNVMHSAVKNFSETYLRNLFSPFRKHIDIKILEGNYGGDVKEMREEVENTIFYYAKHVHEVDFTTDTGKEFLSTVRKIVNENIN